MKMQKKVNIVLVILVIILVSLVSFGGIYYKNKNEYTNKLPSYILGTELQGYRQVTLAVKEKDKAAETDDSSGEEKTSENNEEEKSEIENESNNLEESKEENKDSEDQEPNYYADDFKKTAEIYRARFKSLKVDNFSVICDEDTGNIVISLPENDQTDIILSDITQIGEFTIKDSDTQEVLLNNEDVSSVKIGTQESMSGTKTYMSIYFNSKGTSKFKDVTKEYQNTVSENTVQNTVENKTEEESNEVDNGEETNTADENSNTESAEDKKSKQVTINVDSTTMLTTDFSEVIDSGVLSLTLGNATSTDEVSKDELYSAYNLGAIIENSPLPVEYQVEGNSYISALLETNKLNFIIYIEIGIALLISLVLIIKYRIQGLLTSILSVGFIAILLIVIRYTNVVLSLEGLFAIEICYLLSCIFGVLKSENNVKDATDKEKTKAFKTIMKKYTIILMPVLIIGIVCSFTQWSQLTSLGMILFWGVLISWIYNITISKLID
ncbi:MAG: hypothetical protein IKG14_02745 [Clostridia bacterium]|nr:hypothetical protein [Clostridia bacterium]